MNTEHLFLQRALELAEYGSGLVSPNPMVGCVVVCNGKIIGEGFHKEYGGPHAEVNAIDSVKDKSLLKESTIYVTLEPCSHFGKTPPCADLLISHKVKKVVVSVLDSNPKVAGKGIGKLRAAGVEVEVGMFSEEGTFLNRRFFTFHNKKRPYIILKWAETADGFIARKNYDSKWISNELSRKLVHKWRAEEDAVLIGANTAFYDNPKLNVRDWDGKDPVRLVLDRSLRLPQTLDIFQRRGPTIIYNLQKSEEQDQIKYVKVNNESFLKDVLDDLYQRSIQSVIVEGGAQVLKEFIDLRLWDEARVFKAQNTFEEGIEAPILRGNLVNQETILTDQLYFYRPL